MALLNVTNSATDGNLCNEMIMQVLFMEKKELCYKFTKKKLKMYKTF